MSRLAPLDKALVFVLVPIWAIGFGLAVNTQVQGAVSLMLGLSLADAEHYPVLNGEFNSLHPADLLERAGLQAGDVLLRVGDADLRGVGGIGLTARSADWREPGRPLPVVYERDGVRGETEIETFSLSNMRPWLASSLAWMVAALFLLLRARPTPTVRAFFHAALCLSFAMWVIGAPRLAIYVGLSGQLAAQTLMFPLLLRMAGLFPDDRGLGGRWHRVWPWIFAVWGPFFTLALWSGRWTLWISLYLATLALGAAAIAAVVTHKYRRSDAIGRRQIRWVLVGAYGATLPLIVTSAWLVFDSRIAPLWFHSTWFLVIAPLAILVSIARYNLFDVDRILSATASYNVLLILLGAGILIAAPRAAEALSGAAGVDPGTGQVLLSLGLAAALVPAHRRLRPQIERVFFRERYAVDHGVAELLPRLAHCRDARELTERVGRELHRLLRPEACAVYAALGEGYAPVFVEGRAVPPGFEAGSPLVASLDRSRAPLALGTAGRRADAAPLGPCDRAALETLRAEVVVPVHGENGLVAFLCLGPKRSGDVYTTTDLSLLTAVAETVSRELRRFDQEDSLREAREMQASLRRYVPGAIAEELSSGADLDSGEREVSVLFVDIRGYTGFAESRAAEEIFSTVNRYTEIVSQIVRRHSGSVVEFNGDGMMAVFGAPRELERKERAAVEASREIVETVGALTVDGGETLSVGVGIATGEAFVGNIRAVDRLIWSAIGNTTNLAARLQSLTRELDASVVIDRRTWEKAQAAAADFEKQPEVPIRGRRETEDLYALPLGAVATRA